MTDSVQTALRVFLQAFIGTIVTSGILSSIETDAVVDWSVVKKVAISAAVSGVIAIVSWLQIALEDKEVIPKVLRNK